MSEEARPMSKKTVQENYEIRISMNTDLEAWISYHDEHLVQVIRPVHHEVKMPKGSPRSEAVRTAVGQVADYCFYLIEEEMEEGDME